MLRQSHSGAEVSGQFIWTSSVTRAKAWPGASSARAAPQRRIGAGGPGGPSKVQRPKSASSADTAPVTINRSTRRGINAGFLLEGRNALPRACVRIATRPHTISSHALTVVPQPEVRFSSGRHLATATGELQPEEAARQGELSARAGSCAERALIPRTVRPMARGFAWKEA